MSEDDWVFIFDGCIGFTSFLRERQHCKIAIHRAAHSELHAAKGLEICRRWTIDSAVDLEFAATTVDDEVGIVLAE